MTAPHLSLLPLLLLLLGALTLSQGLRMSGPKKCCFEFANKQLRQEVVSYARTSQRCSNSAVLLKTASGRQVCARPSDSWVKMTMSVLDNKKNPGGLTPIQ